jgi:hypothetical protein
VLSFHKGPKVRELIVERGFELSCTCSALRLRYRSRRGWILRVSLQRG